MVKKKYAKESHSHHMDNILQQTIYPYNATTTYILTHLNTIIIMAPAAEIFYYRFI